MHTEHLGNVRPSWVGFGWFIGAALTSLAVIAMIAVGILSEDGTGGAFWVPLAMFVGFFAAGYFVGVRVGGAPILHAIGIGLFSIVVWFVANLAAGNLMRGSTWTGMSPAFTAGILLLQMVAAGLGGRIGSRDSRRLTAGER